MAESGGRRKRGRPPLLKNYSDPMKSPMAYSSLKMQKVAAATFSKPMMKVSMGASPKKRRTLTDGSSPASSFSSKHDSHNSFRGVLLSTPVKKVRVHAGSSPFTPADNVFSSEPRTYASKCSPVRSENELESPVKQGAEPQNSHFKFSLCVGDDGKAKIAAPDNKKSKPVRSASCSQKPPLTKFDKGVVLELLNKMKSTRRESSGTCFVSNSPAKTAMIRPSELFADFQSSSPQQLYSTQSTMPWTPNCTAILQFKSGFTPNPAIEEVLDGHGRISGFTPSKVPNDQSRSRSNSSVFKYTSGDPLLMNDDRNTDIFVPHQQSGPSTELFLQQLLASPKKPMSCFTSPPSLMTLSPPRASFKQEASNHNSTNPRVIEASKSSQKCGSHPTTPIAEEFSGFPRSIQCTPLIQQTMNGSLHKSFGESFGQSIALRTQQPKLLEHDDARLALRKLIGGSK